VNSKKYYVLNAQKSEQVDFYLRRGSWEKSYFMTKKRKDTFMLGPVTKSYQKPSISENYLDTFMLGPVTKSYMKPSKSENYL